MGFNSGFKGLTHVSISHCFIARNAVFVKISHLGYDTVSTVQTFRISGRTCCMLFQGHYS